MFQVSYFCNGVRIEGIAAQAGLAPDSAFDVSWAYEFPDEEMLARAMLAPGLIVDLIGVVGEEAVRTAIIDALVPYRAPNGTYRLENEWHTLIASA